jgi:glycosyltransferase involved in cell wall biosynthesis
MIQTLKRFMRLVRRSKVADSPSQPGTYVLVLPWDVHQVGGVSQVVINLYREILSGGELQPLSMVAEWSALRPVESLLDGRRTVHLRLWAPWWGGASKLLPLKWILASPLFLTDLLRFCRRHRVAAFNFHYPSVAVFSIALLRALKLYRGALILSFHGLDIGHSKHGGRLEGMLWRFILHHSTALVACSKSLAAEVSQLASGSAVPIHVIHNGLDVQRFISGVDRRHALPSGLRRRDFIVTVAKFEHRKGLDVLLRAFATVRQAMPWVALALIGRSGNAEAELRSLANELGAAGDIFFLESIPHGQVGLFLETAKVFCLPSRSESFGIAILEAGAYSLPVVASRVGGIPEILNDGETGLLVDPDDDIALAFALHRVLADADFARVLGERLHRQVVETFSWKRSYEQYAALVSTAHHSRPIHAQTASASSSEPPCV